jgi:vacuolar-type H+-ATPase catalytic subunit A/Vma1
MRASKGEFRVGEAIEVGRDRRPGEVIRLKGDELVGQVYEDITGARPGDPVYGTGGALSIRLGPGLLGAIFDGLLRPLDIELASETSAPNGDVALAFRPSVATGDVLPPGTAFGMLPDSAIPGGFGTGKTVLQETLANGAMPMSSSTSAAASAATRWLKSCARPPLNARTIAIRIQAPMKPAIR